MKSDPGMRIGLQLVFFGKTGVTTHAKFSSVYHPQPNGAVERANGLIFSGINKFLFDQKKGKWVDELPKVI
jgi:hypothetical protein